MALSLNSTNEHDSFSSVGHLHYPSELTDQFILFFSLLVDMKLVSNLKYNGNSSDSPLVNPDEATIILLAATAVLLTINPRYAEVFSPNLKMPSKNEVLAMSSQYIDQIRVTDDNIAHYNSLFGNLITLMEHSIKEFPEGFKIIVD